jgi:hypothetical protein
MVAFAVPAFAQNDSPDFSRHEISIGYGLAPITSTNSLVKVVYKSNVDKVGALCGSYTYFFNKFVGVGATYCFDLRHINYYDNASQPNMICSLGESSHSIMGHVKFNCLRKKHFVLYAKADAGLCFWDYQLKEYDTEHFYVGLPYQHYGLAWAAATGIEVGNSHIVGFAQCGIGMEGILNLGIRLKF